MCAQCAVHAVSEMPACCLFNASLNGCTSCGVHAAQCVEHSVVVGCKPICKKQARIVFNLLPPTSARYIMLCCSQGPPAQLVAVGSVHLGKGTCPKHAQLHNERKLRKNPALQHLYPCPCMTTGALLGHKPQSLQAQEGTQWFA